MPPNRKKNRSKPRKTSAQVATLRTQIRANLRLPGHYSPDSSNKIHAASQAYKSVFDNQICRYRQIVDLDLIIQQSFAVTFKANYFSLAGLDQAATFAALYDQYKLDLVVLRFLPVYTVTVPVANIYMPRLYTVIDYDDATVPTAISQLREYANVEETMPCQPVIRILVPRVAVSVYSSGLPQNFSNMRTWVDVAGTTVQWYGVKYALEAGLSGQSVFQTYNVQAELYWAFRSVR